VVLHVVEEMQELVVVWPVAGLSGQLVHVRGPAGGFDRGDGHGVDGAGAGFPLFGGGVHDVAFGEGADFGGDGFFLFEQHAADFEVADPGHHGALHDGAAFVVFDVAHPAGFLERDFFGEALLFEVTDGVVVGVGEEVLDWGGGFDVVFQVRHEVRAVAFDLLVRGDGAEDDLGKFPGVERAVGDSSASALILVPMNVDSHSPDNLERLLYDGHGEVGSIVDQACYVVFWHLWQLLLEYAFEPGQDYQTLSGIVIVDHPEFDFTIAFFGHRWLFM